MAKTISELRNQSIQVRDASAAGENTATRVGTVLNDIVGHIEDYENTQSSNNSSQDAKIEGVKSSLDAEIARAKTEESNLNTQIGTERTERQAAVSREETARIQADNDEKTARQQADNAEQDARIKADNDEKTARENADITLRTMIQTEVSNRQIAVKQEEIRAKAAEQANSQAIEDETARAMAAEEAETARATAEEQRLQGEIDNTNDNLSSLDDKVNSNHDHLTKEVARLDLTDNEIKADLEAETTRAQEADLANAQAITDEVARATEAEEANGLRIDDIEGKIYESKNNHYAFINVDKEGKIISSIDRYGNKKENLPTDFTDILTVKGKNVLTEHQDISGKANVGDSYTKKESDELFTTKNEFSDNFEHKGNNNFVNALLDSESKIIESTDKKGKKYLFGGLDIQGADIEHHNNVKSVCVLADKDGRKIINIDKKGYVDIPNLRQKNRTDNVVIVDKSGKGDYTELEECLSNIKDTQASPKTIIVFPGVYTMNIYKDAERRHTGYRNLSIIGVNKHSCIIRQDDGVYTTSPYVDAAAIKIGGNCFLANLTIISTDSNYNTEGTNRSYCVHLDTAANSGDRLTIRDCIMINDHYSCIGIGLKPNYTISIENCELTSTFKQDIQSRGTILCHESNNEGDNNETLILKNNIINNTNGRYAVSIHDGYGVGGVIHCIFKDNVLYAPHSSMPFYRQSESLHIIEFESYGNNVSAMNHSCYRSYPSIFRRNITLQNKKVLVTGDSITRGYINGSTVTERNWPTLLKENIGINTINNTAVGGALFTKISGYGCISDYMNVDVSGYDCVIVAGGANDWQLGVDESTFKQTMKDLVDNINNNYPQDIPVVFITPINVAGYPQSKPIMPLQMYRNIITETVISNDTYRRFSIIQGNEFGFPEASENEKFTNALFGDKIHPTELGYATLYINGVMNYINK